MAHHMIQEAKSGTLPMQLVWSLILVYHMHVHADSWSQSYDGRMFYKPCNYKVLQQHDAAIPSLLEEAHALCACDTVSSLEAGMGKATADSIR